MTMQGQLSAKHYEDANAIATAMNARDAGVLKYTVLSIGAECVIVVTDMTGRELGLL